MKPTNPIYLGDYKLDPPEEDEEEEFEDDDQDFDDSGYNDEYLDPNAP
jgi:hypothetical protein